MHILKRTRSNDAVPATLYDYDDTIGGICLPSGEIRPGADAYNDVIRRVGFYAASFYGPLGSVEILRLQHEIDLVLAKTYGFNNKTRFAQSFQDAVTAYCGQTNQIAAHHVLDGVYRLGMSVFTDYPYAPMEGAVEVVDRTSVRFKTVIVTKGAVDEQERKLRITGFYETADDIFVVGKKDHADWLAVLTELGLDGLAPENPLIAEAWAIGNSAKADVNPLVLCGFNGIHIAEKNDWAFEQAELVAPLHGRVATTVTDIGDILNIIPGI